MSYAELIKRLFAVNIFNFSKMDLGIPEKLHAIFNHPSTAFKSIHVAGTNGKGSVSIKIAAVLQQAGYKVGLYTSPHLSCFRERIKINGEMIPEEILCDLLERFFSQIDAQHISASFFEITTILAFCYFAQEKVDYAVIETGLGGHLDATNIITPVLSVITSISLEHTEILGSTIESIALEKAGIIKPHIPVVVGPHAPHAIFQEIAASMNSPFYPVHRPTNLYTDENRLVAEQALRVLKIPLNAGIHTAPSCRFEVVNRETLQRKFDKVPPTVILDVGHNPHGLHRLFCELKTKYANKAVRILFGLSKNKDVVSCLQEIINNGVAFHPVEAKSERKESNEALRTKMIEMGVPESRIFCFPHLEESLKSAMNQAEEANEILLICGTFFIMGDVRQLLGYQEQHDTIDMNERWEIRV